jgi:hypothetical protein
MLILCTKSTGINWMQIGDKPGWEKPHLNVHYDDGTAKCLPISRQVAEVLMQAGMGSEG